KLHPDYRAFLQGGGDVAKARFEAAVVLPGGGHLDLFAMLQRAHDDGVPRDWLPFVEDNGDYYCITARGEILYWSHNGSANERWPSLAAWHDQVCVRGR